MTITPMPSIDKRALAKKAHHLSAVVLLGNKGLTDALIREIDLALTAHELIKIKLTGAERDHRSQLAEQICQQTQAHLIKIIGQVAILYRKRDD